MIDFGFGQAKRIRVTCNKRPQKTRRRPMFWDSFDKAIKAGQFKLAYDLKKKTDLVMVFVGAESRLPLIRDRQAEGAKIVQRVDGLWGWEHGDIKGDPRNKPIIDVYGIADAVIFQSEFNKQVFEELLDPPRTDCKKHIILNGADPGFFSAKGPASDKFGFKRMLVTAALWREWKGLKNVFDVFEHMDLKDTVLCVIGDGCEVIDHPRIRFVGHQNQREMAGLFRAADAFVYFPWFDWCPNTVVQAILCGLPVVCSSRGGTSEIVGKSGIVIPSVPQGEICKYYEPASVDPDQAARAINEILEHREKYLQPRPDLHLDTCVGQYIEVFQKALDKT